MADHNILGTRGEKLAVELLTKKAIQFWLKTGEVEKTNSISSPELEKQPCLWKLRHVRQLFGDPSDAVSIAKQKRIIQAANDYLEQHELDLEARFDVISIVASGGEPILDHMEDAFYPLA